PPNLEPVGALREGGRRWTLRQGSRPYGAHQARKLRNARKRDEAIPSVFRLGELFLAVKRLGNKGRASLVSAAAVIPAPRVVGTIIGPKASVACSVGLLLNSTAQDRKSTRLNSSHGS